MIFEDKDTTSQSSTSKNENQAFEESKNKTFENRKTRLSEIESQRVSKIEKQDFFENRKSRVFKETESQDFRKSKCNYNNINYTDINYIYPINQDSYNIQNSDQTEERWIDRYTKTVDEIKKAN